ncbi:DUF4276 family protein [Rhizobium leguminosarum]
MARLLVHVEGQTEETFVNEILAPHLYIQGFHSVSARLLGAARVRKHRGGICSWDVVVDEVAKHLKSDGGAFATTIVDYYALPAGADGWPGRDACAGLTFDLRSPFLTDSLHQDFAAKYPNLADRFIPFVAMHEFEGLLFSDPTTMASSMGQPELAPNFAAIRAAFETPEHINDSYLTAPSKRLLAALPGYQKVLHGNVAMIDIGLESIRSECPVFNQWLTTLEQLVV